MTATTSAALDHLRRAAIAADTGYDDDAYMAALTQYGPDSDEQALLHPANFLAEEVFEAEVAWFESQKETVR
jgi:hypothetical protein